MDINFFQKFISFILNLPPEGKMVLAIIIIVIIVAVIKKFIKFAISLAVLTILVLIIIKLISSMNIDLSTFFS